MLGYFNFFQSRMSYDKPRQCIKKDITLLKKVRIVKAMVILVVMYGSESWIIKKAEHERTDTSEL